jgi:hypothetical protein
MSGGLDTDLEMPEYLSGLNMGLERLSTWWVWTGAWKRPEILEGMDRGLKRQVGLNIGLEKARIPG